MLEPDARKRARPVLRGPGRSNAPRLPAENIGDYANVGAEWEPGGQPTEVGVHDFPDPEMGKAIPYGVLDVGANEGWVNVGDDHDTPAFAVASIARWWERIGKDRYPDATALMVTADAGGSNSYRSRAWKAELAKLAATIGMVITVCHMPPGTSKWNKIVIYTGIRGVYEVSDEPALSLA